MAREVLRWDAACALGERSIIATLLLVVSSCSGCA